MKKRNTWGVLLTLALVTVVTSCTKDVVYDMVEESRVVTLVDDDPDSPTCNVEIKMAFLPSDQESDAGRVAAKINNQVLKEFFNGEGQPRKVVSQFVDHYLSEYKSERHDYYIDERARCEEDEKDFIINAFSAYLWVNGEISTGRNGTVCFAIKQEMFNGGAHPVSTTSFVNFNPVTGEEVKLSDLFLSGTLDQLTDKITSTIAANQGVRTMEDLQELGYDNIGTPQEYLIGKDSITFFYNVYEIAPYAMGPTEVKIAYKDLEGILVK